MDARVGIVCPQIVLPHSWDWLSSQVLGSSCTWITGGESLRTRRMIQAHRVDAGTILAFTSAKSRTTCANTQATKLGDSNSGDDARNRQAKKERLTLKEGPTSRGFGDDGVSPSSVPPSPAVTKSVLLPRSSNLEDADHSETEEELLRALKERRTEDAWRFHEVLSRGGIIASQVCLSRLVAQLSHKGTPSSLSRAQKVLIDLQKVEQVDLLDGDSLGLLVMASARTGAGRYALSILRLMFQMDMCPPVKVWSAVVSRLGKHPCDAPLALELFNEICSFLRLELSSGSSSDSNVGIAKEMGKVEEVKPVRRNMKETNISGSVNERRFPFSRGKEVRPDTAAFNAVLNACATVGLVKQADDLLERMASYGVEPDILTFNILIKLFAKAEEGEQLLHILQEMEEAGIEPDLCTYNSLVSSYVNLGELDEAERLVRSMQQGPSKPEPGKIAGSSLIDMPVQAKMDKEMTKVLKGVERSIKRHESVGELAKVTDRGTKQMKPVWRCKVRPNVRTYTTLMKGYVKNGRLKDVVQLLIAMDNQEDATSHPNEVTYTSVIAACVNTGMMDEAKSALLEMVAQNVPPNSVTYNILLKGYCNTGQVSKAYEVIDDMRKAGLSPDAVSYNTLINGCVQRDDNVGALEVFREMRRTKISPTEISYTSLMKAFARNGQPKLVGEVFEEIRNHAWMRVDVIAWNVLIDSYCKAGQMKDAKQTFTDMKEQGFHPSVATYDSLVNGFSAAGQPGEVLVLWNEIQERTMSKKGGEVEPLEPDGGLLDCLVDTCLRAGFFQRALEVVACMEGQGILADKTKYKRMFIDLYSSLYTSKHASARRRAKSADKRSAVDAFKFWLGLPNQYYQSDWDP